MSDSNGERTRLQLLDQRVQEGDSQAMAELFELNRDRLRRIVSARMDQRLKSRVDPSDILQEAYFDLVRRLPNFMKRAEKMSAFVWMRLVTAECVLGTHRDHLAAQKRDARREQSMHVQGGETSFCLAENMLAHFSSAGNQAIRNELSQLLMETLKGMESIDHEIIMMRCFEELTNSEAAESLGISTTGASNRYVRAMARLHSRLKSIPGFMDSE